MILILWSCSSVNASRDVTGQSTIVRSKYCHQEKLALSVLQTRRYLVIYLSLQLCKVLQITMKWRRVSSPRPVSSPGFGIRGRDEWGYRKATKCCKDYKEGGFHTYFQSQREEVKTRWMHHQQHTSHQFSGPSTETGCKREAPQQRWSASTCRF